MKHIIILLSILVLASCAAVAPSYHHYSYSTIIDKGVNCQGHYIDIRYRDTVYNIWLIETCLISKYESMHYNIGDTIR